MNYEYKSNKKDDKPLDICYIGSIIIHQPKFVLNSLRMLKQVVFVSDGRNQSGRIIVKRECMV